MAQVNPWRIAFAALGALLLAAGGAHADERFRLAEQDIKSGLIYNFLKYTNWPAGRQDSPQVQVCLFGRDALDGRLAPMAGRSVSQRVIAVRQLSSPAEAGACDLIFVAENEKARWPALRAQAEGKPALTVADFEGFAANGGMIEFTKIADRIGLRLNKPAIAAAGLEVQGRILQLAGAAR